MEGVVIPPSSRVLPWGSEVLRQEAGDPYASAPADVVKDKTARQALKSAGMDFVIQRIPAAAPKQSYNKRDVPAVEILNKWFARRMDNGAVLGFLGPDHDILQPREMAEFADLLVDTHESSLVGMGATRDLKDADNQFGLKAFVVVKLDEPIRPNGMPEEATDVFLLCSNAWDSSQSFTASIVPYKLACTNGLRYPVKGGIQTWRIRHSSVMRERIVQVQQSIQSLAGWAELMRIDAEKLIELVIDEERIDHVVNAVLPRIKATKNDEGKITNAASISRRDTAREQFTDVWLESDTLADPVRLTAYGALQSYAEWSQWGRALRMDPVARLIGSPIDAELARIREKLVAIKLN